MSSLDAADSVVPQRPVLDLITLREDSEEDQVTEADLYNCQLRWGVVKLYRLDSDRRKDLCTLLVSLVKKVAPDLKSTESFRLWETVSKNPDYPDEVLEPKDE